MNLVHPPEGVQFSDGWASWNAGRNAFVSWVRHMVPVLSDKPVRWLELGSHEGRSAIVASMMFNHPATTITCLDKWGWNDGINEARFDSNIAAAGIQDKVIKVKGDWRETLPTLHGLYDGIYIDADHNPRSVLSQSCLCWELLKPGGFMIWDDYARSPDPGEKHGVDLGVDAFMSVYGDRMTVLHKEWQVIARRQS